MLKLYFVHSLSIRLRMMNLCDGILDEIFLFFSLNMFKNVSELLYDEERSGRRKRKSRPIKINMCVRHCYAVALT